MSTPLGEAGYISDDSDFYGTVDEKDALRRRVAQFDANQTAAAMTRSGMGIPQRRLQNSSDEATRMHNPYAGVPYAWQLTESLDDFLARLPPSTTDQHDDLPWIFICNPYIQRPGKQSIVSQAYKGNEDEAPAEDGRNLQLVCDGGAERLQILADYHDGLMATGMSAASVTKKMAKERREATADILSLAHAHKVRTGKWLLFCPPQEVDEVWRLVARATANNELGIAAKVAPRPQLDDMRKDRLICVYTEDFQNKSDVGRVVQRLMDLRLVERKSRRVYYKPDIFKFLGIARGNSWGLNASIYSSDGFL